VPRNGCLWNVNLNKRLEEKRSWRREESVLADGKGGMGRCLYDSFFRDVTNKMYSYVILLRRSLISLCLSSSSTLVGFRTGRSEDALEAMTEIRRLEAWLSVSGFETIGTSSV
jgi:hypothetical protein